MRHLQDRTKLKVKDNHRARRKLQQKKQAVLKKKKHVAICFVPVQYDFKNCFLIIIRSDLEIHVARNMS